MESGKNLIDITDNRVAHENVRKYAVCANRNMTRFRTTEYQ